ncbi:MAG: cupin domain-containing protein [Sphingomonadaceae bacterium]
MTDEAQRLIAALDLAPHPEGGWFRETWRAPAPEGNDRDAATAILFLLEQGQQSHWHKVDAAELWLFHAGSPITLRTAASDREAEVRTVALGSDILSGHTPQHLVEPGQWQAAEAKDGWSLVACVVVPGFSFEGFELAPPGWSPGIR